MASIPQNPLTACRSQLSGNAACSTNSNLLRLIALGDCNTNSSDLNQGTLPAGVAEAFRDRNLNLAVTNLGAGMTTSREGLKYMHDRGHAADFAILNFGLVDCWTTTIPGAYIPYFYPESKTRKLSRKVLKSVKRYFRMWPFKNFVPMGYVIKPAEYQKNIRAMIAKLRQWNPQISIYLWGTVPVVGNAKRNESIAEYNTLLLQIAQQESVTYIDSTNALSGLPAAETFVDDVHLSPKAARLIGEQISDTFLRQSHNLAAEAA